MAIMATPSKHAMPSNLIFRHRVFRPNSNIHYSIVGKAEAMRTASGAHKIISSSGAGQGWFVHLFSGACPGVCRYFNNAGFAAGQGKRAGKSLHGGAYLYLAIYNSEMYNIPLHIDLHSHNISAWFRSNFSDGQPGSCRCLGSAQQFFMQWATCCLTSVQCNL